MGSWTMPQWPACSCCSSFFNQTGGISPRGGILPTQRAHVRFQMRKIPISSVTIHPTTLTARGHSFFFLSLQRLWELLPLVWCRKPQPVSAYRCCLHLHARQPIAASDWLVGQKENVCWLLRRLCLNVLEEEPQTVIALDDVPSVYRYVWMC